VGNCSSGAVLQQNVEGVRFQKVGDRTPHLPAKACHSAYADAFHSGGAGGFDAVPRVLYNDAMLGATPNWWRR